MIIDYEKRNEATYDEKIQSLCDSVQRALNIMAEEHEVELAQEDATAAKKTSSQALIEAGNARAAAVIANAAAENAASAAASAQTDANTARQAADTATAAVATLTDAVDGLGTRVTEAEGDISDIEGNISDLQSRVSTAESDITSVQGDISDLQSDVSAAQSDISDVQGDITDLTGRVSAAESDISAVEGDVSALNTRVGAAESSISSVETDITGLQTRVTDAESDIDDTLAGLALAQNVVGTVAWLTAHATATTDTTPVSGKTYYIKHQDGTFSVVTDTTGKNPAQEGWYEMDEAVSNYVASHLALTNDGLYVTGDGSDWKVLIADDGVYIVDSSGVSDRIVSEYSDDVIIGDTSAGHVVIDYHSLQGVGMDNEKYFEVIDARDQSGVASIVETHETGTSGATGVIFQCGDVREITSVKINNVETSDYTIRYDQEGKIAGIDFNDPVTQSTIEVELVTGEMVAALTFGTRYARGGLVGQYSVSEGVGNVASGYASHAEGVGTYAIGHGSHAEGYSRAEGEFSHAECGGVAFGALSHAEGDDAGAGGYASHAEGMHTRAEGDVSHAEGFTTFATGGASHAEGTNTEASGAASHAQGENTTASKRAQTVLGTYNIEDTGESTTHPSGSDEYGEFAVIVGNGYYGNQGIILSNALTVDWQGDVRCHGVIAHDVYSYGDISDEAGNVLANKVDAADLAAVATSGDYTDLSNTPTIPTVPTNVSAFTNDAGYLTTETDPTVPTWAKAASKPSYTASEVGALPSTTQIPSATSDLTNDSGFMNATGILNMFYPVGCYYHTSDANFNPNTSWGGTWSLLGEGQVLLSAGSTYTAGQSYGGNTKSYTPGGSIGDTKLTDQNMAHGHGFTQPKTPALTHNGNSGAMSGNSSIEGTLRLRRWGQTGNGVTGSSGVFSTDSYSETAHCFTSGSNNNGTVQRISLSKDISHTHTINHTHAAANCTDGAVSNLSGASSTRTAHGHSWTGTQADINVMQASTACYIWHRTA